MGAQIKETTFAGFVSAYRLRARWTGAEHVVPGKFGEIAVFESDEGLLRLRLLAAQRTRHMPKALLTRRRAALAGGLTLKWQGDSESIFWFDPTIPHQAELAIRLVGAKRKRQVSPEQRDRLTRQLAEARRGTIPDAVPALAGATTAEAE